MIDGGGECRMQRDELVACCLAKPGAEETYPWGDAELVAKVGGKAFAFVNLEGGTVGLKCGRNAEEAAEWRHRYPDAITASSHIGRYGWNAVDWTGRVPDDELRELLDSSYDAIVAALPKSRRPTAG
jgi:predicted DNA-binding protein (MmcQ/YjbR family)